LRSIGAPAADGRSSAAAGSDVTTERMVTLADGLASSLSESEWCAHEMFRKKPNLHFMGSQHVAHQQVVGAVIAQSGRLRRSAPNLQNHHFMRGEQS
jgi:hypothetical protein